MAAHRLGEVVKNPGESNEDYLSRLEDWAKRRITIILKFRPETVQNYFNMMNAADSSHRWVTLAGGREPAFWQGLDNGEVWPYVLCVGSPMGEANWQQSLLAWKIGNYAYTYPYLYVRGEDAAGLAQVDNLQTSGIRKEGHQRIKLLFGLDTGHRMDVEDWLYLPDNLVRFSENPRLANLHPVYRVFASEYTGEAKLFAVSELVFNRTACRARSRTDYVPGLGKMIIDVEKAVRTAAMQGNSIIEDSALTNLQMAAGYETEHTDSLQIKQNGYNDLYEAFAFLSRFGPPCTTDETLAPRSWEFWQSRQVHWTQKAG